jgi:phosphoserine phosphatase
MQDSGQSAKHYLFATDFDQTLSFHDSGQASCELAGMPAEVFERKVAILSAQNLVQQGGELAYLLLHDSDFQACVRRQHFVEAGRKIRLKKNIRQLSELLERSIEGFRFDFQVISAAPQEVVESALEGVVPREHIHGTQFVYDASGHVEAVVRVNAGYGKVAVLDDLQALAQVGADRVVYVGDGSSDIQVMLHVNRRDGYTIAVSESKRIAQVAKRTVLSDDALSVLIPILEDIAGWPSARIRAFFEAQGLLIQEWGRVRTDWLTIASSQPAEAVSGAAGPAGGGLIDAIHP